jgi:hypothetical protein
MGRTRVIQDEVSRVHMSMETGSNVSLEVPSALSY